MLIYSSINYYTRSHIHSIDLFHLTCQYNMTSSDKSNIFCWTIEAMRLLCVYLRYYQSPECVLVPGYRAK